MSNTKHSKLVIVAVTLFTLLSLSMAAAALIREYSPKEPVALVRTDPAITHLAAAGYKDILFAKPYDEISRKGLCATTIDFSTKYIRSGRPLPYIKIEDSFGSGCYFEQEFLALDQAGEIKTGTIRCMTVETQSVCRIMLD